MTDLGQKIRSDKRVAAWLQILLGCLVGGAAYPLFLTPNHIAPGGLTGVAMILNHTLGLPVGIASLAMNVPLFLLSFKAIGGIFFLRSLAATVLFSLAIDFLPLAPMTVDPLLGSVYGGVVLGIGLGMIVRGGATTGGTDMIAKLIHRHLPFVSMGMILFMLDAMVVAAAGVAFGTTEALYAMICIFVSSKVIDTVMVGFVSNKTCFIVSDRWEAISRRILHEMNRGATHLQARGAYSGAERPVLMCVIARQELPIIKEIVRQEDENAFVFMTEAFEVLGEGFSALTSQD